MIRLRPNPFDPATLEDIRLQAQKSFVTAGTGALLRRKLGQSLDYREHRAYAFGDDVRHIDWRASLRHGGKEDYLVRSFEAEERFLLLVVIDDSATMRAGLGEAGRVSKLEIALWICEALGHIATRQALDIALACLDHGREGADDRIVFAHGRQIEEQFARFSEMVLNAFPVEEDGGAPMAGALGRLPQSSVTVFLTDFYRTGDAKVVFEEAVSLARRGYRQAVVCELDSWPTERAILAETVVSLGRIGKTKGRDGSFLATSHELALADDAIAAQRSGYLDMIHQGGVIHCPWALSALFDPAAGDEAFRSGFREFLLRSELFGRTG
ncbi:DUF58 domain-containing protein [Cohaesibacter haloalkalitolerans]|uniref:DUF58 domain-containing protein n=1 Tax=Cohaesibacter haloalkalitolerans TaxID=1162980 RepID=UPI000E65BC8A|nr:DUF58 domain-containing protein [Cohaesibacter haloalkalitolerans]